MALTPRERLIALGVAGVVGLYGLNVFALAPYRATQAELETQLDTASQKVERQEDLLKQQKALRHEWEQMGVTVDPAVADTRLSHYLGEWAQDSKLKLSSAKPERTPSENKAFAQITTHATATGRQRDIARMMWAIANAPIPMKINEMTVASKKDGTDELQMTFSVSTLCVDPDANKPTGRGGRAQAAGGRGGRVVAAGRPTAAGRDPL